MPGNQFTGVLYSIFLTTFFSLQGKYLAAQNLVPNPSLECGETICEPVQYPESLYHYICDWASPTEGTPDVFSTLARADCEMKMPYDKKVQSAHIGSQLPRTGNRFGGIIDFYYDSLRPGKWREYYKIKLTEPLVVNQLYCVEAYVSFAEQSLYAAGKLGFYIF